MGWRSNSHDLFAASYARAAEAVIFALLLMLLLIVVVAPENIPHAGRTMQSLITAFLLFAAVMQGARRIRQGRLEIYIRIAATLIVFDFVYAAMEQLQHAFVLEWNDQQLLNLEILFAGIPWGEWLQRIVNPYLTEATMFAYVSYTLLLPLTGVICHTSGGSRAADDYLLTLGIAFSICFVGFMVFPVASPLHYSPASYTVPLEGGLFTQCGEWIRAHKQYPGGNLPSPHCAGATVMLGMLIRYRKNSALVALPTILLIYAATVYGRYHYTWDAIAGIATGTVALWVGPTIAGFVCRLLILSDKRTVRAGDLMGSNLGSQVYQLSSNDQTIEGEPS